MTNITMPEIHHALYSYFFSCQWMIYNSFAMSRDFESDFLAITKAGYLHEVEIKISRSDFQADFKKSSTRSVFNKEIKAWERQSQSKHELIEQGKLSNYFWFCVPTGLITADEVPDYAGLLYFEDHPKYGFVRDLITVKKAPKIHKNKAPEYVEKKILQAMYYRSWEEFKKKAEQSKKNRLNKAKELSA